MGEAAGEEGKMVRDPIVTRWLGGGAALEFLAGAGATAIATASNPWPQCRTTGDCPSPRPWALTDQGTFVGLFLWVFLVAFLVPMIVGERVRRYRWVVICAAAATASAPVGAGLGVLLARWLSPVAYADVWVDKSVRYWGIGVGKVGVLGLVFFGAPAFLLALPGTAQGRANAAAVSGSAEDGSGRPA
jgi:hypothetical protein